MMNLLFLNMTAENNIQMQVQILQELVLMLMLRLLNLEKAHFPNVRLTNTTGSGP